MHHLQWFKLYGLFRMPTDTRMEWHLRQVYYGNLSFGLNFRIPCDNFTCFTSEYLASLPLNLAKLTMLQCKAARKLPSKEGSDARERAESRLQTLRQPRRLLALSSL